MQEAEIKKAVREFWRARERGTQSDSHPKAFLDLIASDLARAGWTDVAVKKIGGKGRITIPGYFRPAKEWDIVCWDGDKPVVAIELKTQADSYGNNENNRYEEALGNALDVRARYGKQIGLGFVFVICDDKEPNSHSTARSRSGCRLRRQFPCEPQSNLCSTHHRLRVA